VTKLHGPREGIEWRKKAALCGDSASQVVVCSTLLNTPEKAEAYAWYLVLSDASNSMPEEFEPNEKLREKEVAHAKEMAKKVAERLDAATIRDGKARAKQYAETIRANMAERE